MKPPIAYFGGKTGMADLVVSLMPRHRVYIEPFFGSGAVLFAKAPAVHEIVNDLDDAVVTFFRCLRDQPGALEEVCALTPYARAEFELADLDEPGLADLERARRFWARVNQSFAKTAGRRTGWSVTTARTQSTAASVAVRLGRFHACAERLRAVSIERCDAAELVERLATDDSVTYVDPPYLGGTRFLRTDRASDYRCDMGDEASHRRLAEALRASPGVVILSGYPSPIYDELYDGWWHIDVHVSLHSSNATTAARGRRVERIWMNQAPLAGLLELEFAHAGTGR